MSDNVAINSAIIGLSLALDSYKNLLEDCCEEIIKYIEILTLLLPDKYQEYEQKSNTFLWELLKYISQIKAIGDAMSLLSEQEEKSRENLQKDFVDAYEWHAILFKNGERRAMEKAT